MYSSKSKYDVLCNQRKAPIETMEQYLYTYLKNKYGLKTLIVEWAVSVVNAIKMFKDEDHDVYLFAKILKNRCEEDFVESQQQVRDTINAILKLWAREKYVYKPDHQIDLMMPEIRNSRFSIEFYTKVLEKLYPEERDRVYVEMYLQEYIQSASKMDSISDKTSLLLQNSKIGSSKYGKKETRSFNYGTDGTISSVAYSQQKPLNDDDIPFSVFEKIVLDYQLNEHCKFLDKFTELFRQIDSDTNGVISRAQFMDLCFQMNIIEVDGMYENSQGMTGEAQFLLSTIDPFETDHITFSEIVKVFTAHTARVELGGSIAGVEQISVLEKFVSKAIEQDDYEKQIMVKLQERAAQEATFSNDESKVSNNLFYFVISV